MNRPIVLILMLLGAHPCFAVDVIAAPAETAQTGMTWGVSLAEAPPGIVLVGCHGLPVSPIGSCDAYVGDTSCSASLPVLCVNIDGREMPPGLHPTFYSGWLAGEIALAPRVRGDTFVDRVAANLWCSDHFGSAWRMGEHHDRASGSGGWGFYAAGAGIGENLLHTRFWTAINDTAGNCWDKKSRPNPTKR